MSFDPGSFANRFHRTIRTALMGPQILAFLPALMLGGFWYGGEGLLMYMALLFPGLFALAGLFSRAITGPDARDNVTGLRLRAAAIQALDRFLSEEAQTGLTTATLAVSLDDIQSVERQFGSKARASVLRQTGERIKSTLRDSDLVVRLDEATYGVILAPVRRCDLETLIQLSSRLQTAIAEPYSVDATRIYVSSSIGFCSTGRITERTGEAMLEAALAALATAVANGAGSIRAYSPETKRRADARHALRDEMPAALEGGQILPWFQPQVSTDTGAITGLEALARWEHPKNGVLPQTEFLDTVSDLGLQARLGEIILYGSLTALREWDKAGQTVPRVSVNLSSHELGNPKLCEKIRWELDRFELTPDRLCIEILEDVVAAVGDEVIVRNIYGLSALGCYIDLDDFGTGHASITNVRRFAIDRIKIDKSFIARVDRDREQQNMVSAVLAMAGRLEIDTLAEGVETIGEHAMLSKLGCGHVQGFSVAKPMPYQKALEWIVQHRAKRTEAKADEHKIG